MHKLLSKFEPILTENKLAIIGIYDETYSLYNIISEKYSKYLHECSLSLNNPIDKVLNPFLSVKSVKKILDDFVEKYTILYSEKYPLHVNYAMLNKSKLFDMFKYDRDNFRFKLKIITFNDFLKELDFFIIYRHLILDKGTNENRSLEQIYNIIKSKFDNFVFEIKSCQSDILKREIIQFSTNSVQNIRIVKNLHNLICNREKHHIESKLLEINNYVLNNHSYIPVNYCSNCEQYFIGFNSFLILQDIYNDFLLKSVQNFFLEEQGDTWLNFGVESELHKYGYNVIMNKLTDFERQNILIYLIDNNIMNKFNIRRDLEKAINLFKNRDNYQNAVYKWKCDLEFVDNYGNDEFISNGELK